MAPSLDISTKSRNETPQSSGIELEAAREPVKTNADVAESNKQSTGPQSQTNAQQQQQQQSDETPRSTKCQRIVKNLVWLAKDQWFLIAMGLIILIASQVQVPSSQQHIKRTIVTYLSVSVIFFINGCTLSTRVLVDNYKKWKIHAFVQLQCYLVTSAATFAIVSLCATNPSFMDPWLLIGFLFLGSVPTTMSSNVVMTRQAHGNTALTVVQSVIGNFLCPFLTPILLQMYLSCGAWYTRVLGGSGDDYTEIYRRVFKQLGLSLFLPMALRQLVQYLFPTPTKKLFMDYKLIKLSSLALLALIWQTFDQAFRSHAFAFVQPSNIVFIVFISIALYGIWLGICFAAAKIWLDKRDVIACCYCCPSKALSMVVPLSAVMYIDISPMEQSKLQIPAVVFQSLQVAIGGVLTLVFRRWIRPSEEEGVDRRGVEEGRGKQEGAPGEGVGEGKLGV